MLLVWTVREHASSSVAYATYQALLDRAATLVPLHCRVVFLADRGFVDTDLLPHLSRLGWHWRLRLKRNLWIYRPGHGRRQVGRITLAPGHALCWHNVYLTEQRYGPVHVALAQHAAGAESWFLVSDEPTTVDTFEEYGLRFDIEENFLDDKSNGFQLEASWIRSTEALSRLCFVLALTTLYLVAQGVAVVAEGKRRWVGPHWFRGSSYLKIGWQWVKTALAKGTRCSPSGVYPAARPLNPRVPPNSRTAARHSVVSRSRRSDSADPAEFCQSSSVGRCTRTGQLIRFGRYYKNWFSS